MGRHAKPDEPTANGITPVTAVAQQTRRPEPVAIAAAAQAVLAALVTLGWVTLDDTTIRTIATAIGVVIAGVITLIARSKVTPVSDPQLG